MPKRCLLIAAAVLAASFARAAERNAALDGPRLVIDGPCAREVDVQPDSSLHDHVLVNATADHEEELDHLLMEGGASVRLHTKPGACWRPSLFGTWRGTLRLAVRVPESFGVTINESSVAAYTLGEVGGTLALDLSGVSEVTAQSVTDLAIELSGMGHVHVAQVRGAAKMELSGGGDVTLGKAISPTLTADLSGAGALVVEAGEIGQATVESSGVGTVRIGAVVGGAHVDLSGMGSVHFTRATGPIEKEVSGLGSVTVGQ